GLGDMPSGEVAAADVDHLARLYELLHRLPDLLPGRVPVDVVHLVEVDVIRLQPAQAFVAGALDVVGGKAGLVGPVAHRAVDLRRQHDLLAASAALGQPAADDVFRDALPALLP